MKHIIVFLFGCTFLTACSLLPTPNQWEVVNVISQSWNVESLTGVISLSGSSVTISGVSVTGSIFSSGEIMMSTWLISVSSGTISPISGEVGIISSKDMCVFDICIRAKKPYFTVADSNIQIVMLTGANMDNWEYLSKLPEKNSDGNYMIEAESSRVITLKKNLSSGSVLENEIMSSKRTDIQEIQKGKYFIKETSNGCGGSSIKQYFRDNAHAKISFDTLGMKYPKTLQVGKIVFSSYWTEESISYLWHLLARDGVNEIEETYSIHDDIGAILLARMKEKKEFTHAYAFKFREYPWLVFFYQSNLQSAERVISLGTDKKWLEENIDAKWNLLNLALTKKILDYYEPNANGESLIPGGKQVQKKGDTQYDKIQSWSLTSDLMPVFRVVSLDGAGNYVLYTTDGYEAISMAELCKPLVYVYDVKNRENSLSISLPFGWKFTKIIPDFSYENTWNFQADETSHIQMRNDDTKNYSYLYYSVKVSNYTYNQDGWQVYGRDIWAFFNEKLDVIGFNAIEKKDFIEYWVSEFSPDTLYFVSFKFDAALDLYVALHFQETPKMQMRVLLEAYPMIQTPNTQFLWPLVQKKLDRFLLPSFQRTGEYDVFEWGWTVQKKRGWEIHIH